MNRYKTSWPRLGAAIVDAFVFVPIGLIDSMLLSPSNPAGVIICWAAVSYSSYWLYSTILHARFGQTVGKKLLRIKVLDLNEERLPSFRQAFLRDIGIVTVNTLSVAYLAYLVLKGEYTPGSEFESSIGSILVWAGSAWLLIELLTMFTNEKRRALHDYIASTVVVRAA